MTWTAPLLKIICYSYEVRVCVCVYVFTLIQRLYIHSIIYIMYFRYYFVFGICYICCHMWYVLYI